MILGLYLQICLVISDPIDPAAPVTRIILFSTSNLILFISTTIISLFIRSLIFIFFKSFLSKKSSSIQSSTVGTVLTVILYSLQKRIISVFLLIGIFVDEIISSKKRFEFALAKFRK